MTLDFSLYTYWQSTTGEIDTVEVAASEENIPSDHVPVASLSSSIHADSSLQLVLSGPSQESSPVASPQHTKSDESSDNITSSASSSVSSIQSSSSLASPVPSELSFSDSLPEVDTFLGPEPHVAPAKLHTYKLVGDNIDKNVRPREMRSDCQTRSLHYFHTYAVRDRVNLSDYSSEQRLPDISTIQLDNLLPSKDDETTIRKNFAVLAGRTLMKYVPFFAKLGKGLERQHILHEFSSEMACKSEVVGKQPFQRQPFQIYMYYSVIFCVC